MWVAGIILLLSTGVYSSIQRFTNVKCEVLDPSYCSYKQCELKILDRNVVGLNVHALLLKGPFNNAKVNLSLLRRYNGFRPFMFNMTFNFCKAMAEANKKLSFVSIVLDSLRKYSNINHSCPYENAIVVQHMVFKEEYLKYIPLPSGEYQLQITAATDNHWKTRIYVNFMQQEDMMKS